MNNGEKWDLGSDAPTLLPGSHPVSPERKQASKAVQTPPPSSNEVFDTPTLFDNRSAADTHFSAAAPSASKPLGVSGETASQTTSGFFILYPGTVLGGRYQILQLLGEGGMGAVYKAQDRELGRVIALKVIRPELANKPEILQRFKQELILARQVTDRNVIRIFDLGEAQGIRFITMEYVEGQSLHQILRQIGKLPLSEAVDTMRQMFCGLKAAHREGIIHRDLKPGNVMRDGQGRVVIMDFGLARSLGGDGMTQTGALLGTMEYMSPEQAQAKELDARSDLFTVGLICYELLTGKMPYQAESAIASLLRRTQERARPISDLDSSIPPPVSQIIARSLERDPALRYQSADEVLADLDLYQNHGAAASLKFPHVSPWGQGVPWQLVGAVAVVLILAVTGYLLRGKLFSEGSSTAVATAPLTSVAILPLRNASGDPSLDWLGSTIPEMLNTEMGQSSSLRTVNPSRIHQIFSDLRISPGSSLDPQTISRIADFSGADRIVWGQYAKFGDEIRIDATLQDIKNERSVPLKIEIANEKEIPGGVTRLAESIREKLALPGNVLKELKASSFQPSTKSLTALRDYGQGVQLMRQGKNLEALNAFQAALKDDSQFALAFSGLAESDAALGYDNDAEQNSRKAVDLAQSLPLQEKYLIEASHARVVKDKKKAIEAYENLAKVSPENVDIRFALGSVYEDSENLDKARANYDAVLKADPNNLNALLAVGRVMIKNGDTQAGLDPLNRALTLAVQFDNQEQKALILLAMGIAYRVLNKPEEALRDYQQSLEINRKLGQKRGVAANLIEMAQVQNTVGKPDAALGSYKEALDIQREIGARKETGDTLINIGDLDQSRGQYDAALDVYKQSLQIQRDAGDETYQALCLNNIGNVYFNRGDFDNALTYMQQALQLREKLNVPADIAETLHNEGQTFANIGQYDRAMSDYMRAIELYRKAGDQVGAATVSHAMGLVFESQGRYGAAINAMQDALKSLRDTGEKSPRLVQSLADLSGALARSGRMSEAEKPLGEAETLAESLKNSPTRAAILSNRGDVAFYSGDWKRAEKLYSDGLRATSSNERETILNGKINRAKAVLADGHSVPANELRNLVSEADALGIGELSVAASILVAQGMISAKDFSHATEILERSLGSSEKMGLRLENIRIHYLLGTDFRLEGQKSDADKQYRATARGLDEIRKEPGAEKLMERADLKNLSIYTYIY
ncbi:MAG: hypothetical protein NVS1B11_36530 [Terriglobales bacterium]